ncbi:MAG: hypothetical protein VX255_13745, partial [Candidatus Latescibacterota bacterium]|nr:hypothetical protein [Candidatus Latescibacterota bacterium]
MKQNWKPLLILALLVTAVMYLYPTVEFYGMAPDQREALEYDTPATYYDLQRKAINLGLDLQGGIHLVMEVVTEGLSPEEARDAVDRAQEVIRNRVDQLGVAQTPLHPHGGNPRNGVMAGGQD